MILLYDLTPGSFLVQAMVKELADCERAKITDSEKKSREKISKRTISNGVEIEEDFFVEADPDIFTMIHERTI